MMRHALFTTVAAAALVLGASAFAQTSPSADSSSQQLKPPATSTPGASEKAPGRNQTRSSASSEGSGNSETAAGRHESRPTATSEGAGQSGTASDQAQGRKQSRSSKASPEPSQHPATTGSTSGSDNTAESSQGRHHPAHDSSGTAKNAQPGSDTSSQAAGDNGQKSHKAARSAAGKSDEQTHSASGSDQQKSGSSAAAASPQRPSSDAKQQSSNSARNGISNEQNSAAQHTGSTNTTSNTSGAASRTTSTNTVADLNTEQHSKVVSAFSSSNVNRATNVDINVSVGTTIPTHVHLAPIPRDVVEIAPQYRGFDYVVVHDEIVIVQPHTKKVVAVIDKSGGSRTSASTRGSRKSASISLTAEQRKQFRSAVETTGSTRSSSTRIELREGEVLPPDVTLLDVPTTIVTEVPDLRPYRYVVIGDEIAVVQPDTREVIDIIHEQ